MVLIMEKILVEELVKFKMLPFDLYSENGEKLLDAGEILTSGKLLQFSQYNVLYRSAPKNQEQNPISQVQTIQPTQSVSAIDLPNAGITLASEPRNAKLRTPTP